MLPYKLYLGLGDILDESEWIRVLCLGQLGEVPRLDLKGFLSEKRLQETGVLTMVDDVDKP